MTTVETVERAGAAVAEAVAGAATPSQAPAARTTREWIVLATKVLAVVAALIPANLAYWGDAEGKAAVADAKAETAYAVLRERVIQLDGQLGELRADLADVRALLTELVVQRESFAAPPVAGRHGEVLRAGRAAGGGAAVPDEGAPNPEAVSDMANIADLARSVDAAVAQRVLQPRAVDQPPAPWPSLDQAVERQAQAK
jgi:hypothetical protein